MSKTPATTLEKLASNPILEKYEPVIGIEVHCQLMTKTKLFCGCSTTFGALPNHHVCPVCLGLPGVIPVLNTEAVNFAVRLAIAIGAEVSETSVFARKQYFYPDLPKGYQITQFDQPYCSNGSLQLASGKVVRIRRAHMEEDAGKSVHGDKFSFVDLNRAGTPLVEVVTEADLGSAEESVDYLKRLHSLVKYLEICDGNLEEGSFRCDINISLRKRGVEKLGTRCEIKNLNSFRNVERAINYEIVRQADVLDHGGEIKQATLLFDAASGRTSVMRLKEDSHDYRYFPEPDLLPVVIGAERVAHIRGVLPELPEAMATRFETGYQLPKYDAQILTSDRDLAGYFELVVKRAKGAVTTKIVANWIISEVLREANEQDWNFKRPPVSSDMLGDLLVLIGSGTISGKIAKTIFEEMVARGGGDPETIMKEKGLAQVSDLGEIVAVVEKILAASQSQVAEFLSGKEKIFGYFVGEVMKASKGKMNPSVVNQVIRERLNALRKS